MQQAGEENWLWNKHPKYTLHCFYCDCSGSGRLFEIRAEKRRWSWTPPHSCFNSFGCPSPSMMAIFSHWRDADSCSSEWVHPLAQSRGNSILIALLQSSLINTKWCFACRTAFLYCDNNSHLRSIPGKSLFFSQMRMGAENETHKSQYPSQYPFAGSGRLL